MNDALEMALRGLVLLSELEMPDARDGDEDLYDLWQDSLLATLKLAVAAYYAEHAREVCG